MIYQNTAAARRYKSERSTLAYLDRPVKSARKSEPRRRNLVPINFHERRRQAIPDRRAA